MTGAANGLGLAMTEVLSANGANVTMLDIDPRVIDEAARLDPSRETVRAFICDVCDPDGLRRGIEGAFEANGRLDIVCANAGKGSGSGPLTEAGALANVTGESWSGILDLNLTATFHTLKYSVPLMRRRKYGRIIVTSSFAGLRGEALVGYAYSATKAAVANMVRHAAIELSLDNILINAIAPGPFRTNIGGGRMHESSTELAFAGRTRLKRIAEPDEVKGLTLLLASPASSYITGTVIPIDGGGYACG
ncbi:SDR family NAD(P)-dependent oxidoreductase [Bradyrhizobium sp. AS23.2]|uniref:SDR family NAD(P)-dependent oxidoreductase n=1 Tax=Bradyrhizobium sp. AS23.2 TaxID=1680155 RepID=UPI001FD9A8AE|nr:SDR family NAD(P)-dependent oxidoreductase [Bradyrhizobium sp. AS23.2]